MPRYEIYHLQANVMFDAPLYTPEKLLLMPARRLVTADDLAALKKWQVDYVETSGRKLTDQEVERILQTMMAKKASTRALYGKVKDYEKKRAFEFYVDAEGLVRTMSEALCSGMRVDPEKPRGLVRRLVEEIRRSRDIYLNIIHNDYGKEEHLVFHMLNNMVLCLTIGVSSNMREEDLLTLGLGAFFADIGMLKVPKHVRDKTRELTESDLSMIRKHPLESEKILNRWIEDYDDAVIRMAVEHHENVDGSGYPYGKKSHEIHSHAKILALADVYNAMTKKRTYREGKAAVSAMKELLLMKDKKFDAAILKTFLGVMSVFPVGTIIKLSDGTFALVVRPNVGMPLQPIVKVLFDAEGKRLEQPVLVDLRSESPQDGVKIVGPVDPASLPRIDIVDEL
ncbi:MAG: hypothetical protein A3G34_11385 [Candidatus Lindowbacteria bacterium RIFCSPLOWO2_12_FULL_62_27]|nr:MAG: hypothetical protein A3I06_16345 [Candidatus Lindowbacteria bacterium RIFCSPLOWO2_02_FULL_62_12]OGH60715.1 MAG: hypothetical protein A3G34_11385 [Candidatus Lindowbacteria bacterium RIFCSPLOWO2_12_FULL_62_27]